MSTKSEDLTLTYDQRSPFARLVLVVINELGISVKKDLIDLIKMIDNKSKDFMKMNPRGLIPILTVGEESFGESRAICRYLINSHLDIALNKKLISNDPKLEFENDRLLWISVEVEKPIYEYLNIRGVMFRHEGLKVDAVEKIKDMLNVIQTFLMRHDNKFLAGPNITLPDLFCAMPIFTMYHLLEEDEIMMNKFPQLKKWYERVTSTTSWLEANKEGIEDWTKSYKSARKQKQ